jgi:hypothetical protein
MIKEHFMLLYKTELLAMQRISVYAEVMAGLSAVNAG